MSLSVTLPPGASLARSDAVVQQILPIVLDTPGVSSVSVYSGMDGITFSPATNSGQMWPIFDPFEDAPAARVSPRTSIAADLRKRLARDHGGGDPHHQSGVGARPRQHRRLPDDDRGPRRSRLSRARRPPCSSSPKRRPRTRRSRRRSATSTRATRRSTPSSTATRPRCSACRCAACSRRCRRISPARTSTTSTCSAIRSR